MSKGEISWGDFNYLIPTSSIYVVDDFLRGPEAENSIPFWTT
jgi:hypothetical protein